MKRFPIIAFVEPHREPAVFVAAQRMDLEGALAKRAGDPHDAGSVERSGSRTGRTRRRKVEPNCSSRAGGDGVPCSSSMTGIGPLPNEAPEPMTREDFERIRARVRAEWSGHVPLDKRDAERLIAEIAWLKRRLRAVEFVLEPLVDAIEKK